MKLSIARGSTSVLFHIFIYDSTATDGSGKTNLAFGDFSCRYIRAGEALSGAITAQDITTIGTYAAPTANTNIRIKKVDDSNMPGWYEVQLHNDWVNTTNSCRTLGIQLRATGAAPVNIEIELTGPNNQDATAFGLTLVPANVTQISGDSTAADNLESYTDGTTPIPANVTQLGGVVQSLTDLKDFADDGYDPSTNKVQGVVLVDTATNLTNAATSGDLTATMKASVNTEVDTGIADARLDELLAADSDIDGAAPPTVGSVFHELMSKSTGSFTFDQTTDSLEAIRDKEADIETDTQDIQSRLPAALVSGRIDASVGAMASDTITSSAVAASAVTEIQSGLATAAELSTVEGKIDTIDDFLDTEVAAIKAKTDLLVSPLRTGTAQAGASGSITLDSGASSSDDFYNNALIVITSGTGIGQARFISDYVGSTKVASTQGNWITNPDNTSTFAVVAFGSIPGASAPTVTEIRQEMDNNSTRLAAIETDTQDIQNRLPAALVSGRMDASVGAMQSNTVTAAALATDAVTEIQSGLSTLDAAGVRTAIGLASANLDTQLDALPTAAEIADAVWDEDATTHQTQGTFGQAIGDPGSTAVSIWSRINTNLDVAISTRLASSSYTAPLDAAGTRTAIGLASANLDTQLDALPTALENADALLKRDMSAVTGEAARSPLNALRALRNKVSVAAGVATVTKEDDVTSAWTAAVTTTAGADPITVLDPA